MGGGGALAAYQVGVLAELADERPDLRVSILSGVSAGAINAVGLGALEGDFRARVAGLQRAWEDLTPDQVFDIAPWSMIARALKWTVRLGSGGMPGPRPRSLLGTGPLRKFLGERFAPAHGRLEGIGASIEAGAIDAVTITASSYTAGRSTTWIEARTPIGWDRQDRIGRPALMHLDHVMASTALPLLFPAVFFGGEWYGDGGMLLTAPLSPAVRLGADRILAVSTRFRSPPPAYDPEGHPPPARIAGALLNALFLDQFDADALRLERINDLLGTSKPGAHGILRPVGMMVLRPSVNLAQLANAHEARLPWALRFMFRGLGTKETRDNQLLSLLMFQREFIGDLLKQGRADARARMEELLAFVG